ncbi:MAG: peptide chain release factor N(5)-glutamine methyltransferase [Pseudomonadota bacterium]
MSIIDDAIAAASLRFVESDSARLDAELLLCAVLDKPRTYLYTWPDKALSDDESQQYEALIVRRVAGEPVAHILGARGFWTLDLRVTADTLIPRPETELLVETALTHLPESGGRVVDLGTGSGAIALAIASECPACEVAAVERSEAALEVARENARRNGLDNVSFHHGSWYQPLAGQRFALIVSNPPYICAADPHLQEGDVRFEPITALASGADGLDDIRLIIAGAQQHLEPGGWLLLEHGYDQGEAVCALLLEAGFEAVDDLPDLQGHGRVAVGRLLRT